MARFIAIPFAADKDSGQMKFLEPYERIADATELLLGNCNGERVRRRFSKLEIPHRGKNRNTLDDFFNLGIQVKIEIVSPG